MSGARDSAKTARETEKRDRTCCFSGYRPEKLPWGANEDDERCKTLKAALKNTAERVYRSGIRYFVCGMARGSDTYFCEAVLELRAEHPDIAVEAAIPCEQQPARWSLKDRDRYFALLRRCDSETCISRKYTRDCMTRRNRFMVDRSSVLIAVYDGKSGGTMNTLKYAERRGLEIIEITP